MTKVRRLQLTLEEGDAKVLAAALSVLPLILDGTTLQDLLATIREHDQRLLIVMTAALMAGAEHTATMQEEMNEKTLAENIERGKALVTKIHNWLHDGEKMDANTN